MAIRSAAERPLRAIGCARSCSIPRRPGSIPSRGIGWSRSAASSSSTASRAARSSTAIVNPGARHAGRGVRGPRPLGRVPQGQAAVCRDRRRADRLSSATRRWSRTMRSSISASSMPSSSARAKMLVARERLVDTLMLARRKHPGGSNRLDDLCARYGIDNSRRTKHGALLDAELLAEVYLELIGARQAPLILVETGSSPAGAAAPVIAIRVATATAAAAAHARASARRTSPSWRPWEKARSGATILPARAALINGRSASAGRPPARCSAPRAADRARRNRPDRAAAAESRRCAPRWRRSRARTETAAAGIRS